MSKDLHNNERYLKELADKYEPAPPTLVWDEIEQVLNKEKGKRRSFPIFWILGALAMGTMLFINLSGKEDKDFSIVEQETIPSDYQKQSDSNPSNIRTVDSETIGDLNQELNAKISETVDKITAFPVSDDQEKKNVNSKKLKSFITELQPSNNLNTSISAKSLKANTINSNGIAITTKENIFSSSMNSPTTKTTLRERHIIPVTTLQRLKWMRISFETAIPQLELNENLIAIHGSKSKRNTSLDTPWFLELGGGIGRNLSNPLIIDPMQEGFRLNTESKWYSWSTSIKLGYQFDNLWYIAFGFDFNQTKKRFDFWRRNVSSLSLNGTQNFQISKNDFFNIGETRYTFIDLGLSIGKRIHIDKWHFSLEGGPIFNVLFNANGKVQVGASEFSRLENQEDYFNTKIGIGGRLSAMLDYPFSDQLWISMGPTYHQYFNTVSSNENPLKERNTILQLKASIRYHF